MKTKKNKIKLLNGSPPKKSKKLPVWGKVLPPQNLNSQKGGVPR